MDDDIIVPGVSEREIYIRRRVRRLAEFYRHLAYYVVVCTALFIGNYFMLHAQPPRANGWWAFFPIVGWGIGVVGHALTVFSPIGFFSLDWEERKVRELVERSKKESSK
jgi:2TM domain